MSLVQPDLLHNYAHGCAARLARFGDHSAQCASLACCSVNEPRMSSITLTACSRVACIHALGAVCPSSCYAAGAALARRCSDSAIPSRLSADRIVFMCVKCRVALTEFAQTETSCSTSFDLRYFALWPKMKSTASTQALLPTPLPPKMQECSPSGRADQILQSI
eukprot:6436-Heterococcus_DN1.PRE.6